MVADDDVADPGRAMLDRAVELGLLPPALAAEVDAWAEALAKRMAAGELTDDELQRLICERIEADLARRGQG